MATPVNTEIERQLYQDEGKVRWVYKDSLGYSTIGAGFLVDKAKGGGLDDEEIAFILQHRLDIIDRNLRTRFPWVKTLDAVRYGALQNMSYQLGVSGVAEFGLFLAALREGNYPLAASEMLSSLWAKQTPARAKRLSQQVLTGEWQWI